MSLQIVLISGCSSGIGLATAVLLAKDSEKRFKVSPFCLKRKFNLLSSFVQLVCAPELALLIFKFPTRGLILESAHLLTLLPPFSIALTLILSK